ncbi:TadE/TadG family type IV pilus assembly protein [Bradyrhizobium sp.]|uniref:TadE/TadG family type IV pilus assembly protein n=1 Tax=Bradyrhizobium sp. TaxID=376 RepID=UPI003C5E7CB2
MPSPSAPGFRNLLRRFRRGRRGSAVVQFALIAPMFFALLFAIIETAMVFFASQVLETITQESARMILTGQAQTGSYTQAQFLSYVCSQIPAALFSCSGIYVDVESSPAGSAFPVLSLPIDCNINAQYNPGGPGDPVVVRVFYQWPIFVTSLGYNIANCSGSKRLLTGVAAFQNEPY